MEEQTNFQIMYPHAAGIDCGSREHVVAIGQHKERDVKRFGTFTQNLEALCAWLKENGITHAALESTGSYWQVLYFMLYDFGITPFLVQPAHAKNPTNSKTDPRDARWLQKLMSCGLLNNSFQPDSETEELRTLMRERKRLVGLKSKCAIKMNRMLVLQNVRLDQVQSRTNNVGAILIVEAIIKGNRNAQHLITLFKNTGKSIAGTEQRMQSLQGKWNEQYIFVMKQQLEQYRFCEKQMSELDAQIVKLINHRMKKMEHEKPELKKYEPQLKKQLQPNDIKLEASPVLYKLSGGVDIGAIWGVGNNLMMTLLSETGLDLKSKFKTEKHFVSWLHLCPNNKVSGGKILSRKTRHYFNALKCAFRDAANVIGKSKNQLGEFFRKVKMRKGYQCAVTATARKLAVIIYKMLTRGEQFKEVKAVV